MAVHVEDANVFGMRMTALRGRIVDPECRTCRRGGSVEADEFQSTRCGPAACASSQGRTE